LTWRVDGGDITLARAPSDLDTRSA
jgi:hypothetical protein